MSDLIRPAKESEAELRLYPLKAVQERIGVSVATLFRMVAAGKIQTVKVGGRTMVSHKALSEFFQTIGA